MAGILNVDEIADSTGTRPVNFPNGISIDNNRISGIPGYNYIINGNFDIWQRGTSQTASGYGSDDRWKNVNGGSTKTASRQLFSVGESFPGGQPTPLYFSRTVVSSVVGAANFVAKQQLIENVNTLAGKKATISLWAKADSGKNIAIEFIQNFGTGGSPSSGVNNIGTRKLALTPIWQRFVVTIDVPSISGKVLGTDGNNYLGLNIWFDAGSNLDARTANLGHQSGTFDIACVSLVEGDVDVKPIPRSRGEEFALCQRYYTVIQQVSVQGRAYDATNGYVVTVTHPVAMRATPSAIITNDTGGAVTTSLYSSGSAYSHTAIRAVRAGSDQTYGNAAIKLDAEL